ncbi:MAG: enoyl-CoA hydratase/isomerase family protein [Myxococcota bacterium]
MSARRDAPVLALAELARALRLPDAAESFSPAIGPGFLAIDLEASAADPVEPWVGELLPRLAELPCVTIAIGPEPAAEGVSRSRSMAAPGGGGRQGAALEALAAACDVRLASRAELEPFQMGFEKTPLAALAFVQLLRAQAGRTSVAAGLAAESFVYSTLQAGPEFAAWLAGRRSRRRRVPADREPVCLLAREGGRLELRLNRPSRHNAFSRALRDALCEGLGVALADPSIERVVLRGEGESFCSGGDLDEFGSFPDPATAHAIRTTRSPALLLARLAGRVRSEIHGACIGAGIELPAFTDHVVADEDTRIELPEVRLGLVPGAGGTVSITRRIGRQRTAWLGLSGRPVDARTALDWGLVDEVRLRQHGPPRTGG